MVRGVVVGDTEVRVVEAGPADGGVILFLHGGRFSSRTWQELGSLTLAARNGFRAVAIDLPGFGETAATESQPAEFLLELLNTLGPARPVIVSPSMSGKFSLPFVSRHPDRIAGFVPVAPAYVEQFRDELGNATAPALVLWGDADQTFPVQGAEELHKLLPGSAAAEVVIVADAGHACYLDRPEPFHQALFAFAARVHGD